MYRKNKLNYALEIILAEISKCELICENCHRLEHIDMDKFNRLKNKIFKKVSEHKEKSKPINKEKVIKMYMRGYSVCKIAKLLKCYNSAVSRIITISGLRKSRKTINKNDIISLSAKGLNGMEIAKHLGCCNPYVYRILKNYK
jgi:hypothetical protein